MTAPGISTMPEGDPELTIGWGVIEHAVEWIVQPDGPRAGQPWQPTAEQVHWLLWWYSVDPDGRWLFHHGVRRQAKGVGKSPFAAVQAIEEFVGPVRLDFDRFDGTPASCFGKRVDMPLVQIAATAESQTANTMRMVRAMLSKQSRIVRKYGIDVGKTIMYLPGAGELQVITSSASAAEGAPVTFAVEDETEHWTPATGGPSLSATIDRNLGKLGNRAVETANAWDPGAGSVAETTFEAWRAMQEGRTRDHEDGGSSGILYDARIAPADTDLTDEKSLTAGLAFVYKGCPWVDIRTIIDRIWDPRTDVSDARRFYLNQPTASVDSWVTPVQWEALKATPAEAAEGPTIPARQIEDGESIVMFFDGSKSSDATGLVGCAMSDGHIFTLGGWEPEPDSEVPAQEIDATVARAFDRYDVVAFFADVREWESFVKVSWPALYADQLLVWAVPGGKEPQSIAWDMRSRTFDFTAAAELTHEEIIDQTFTHDGNIMLARHVENARRRLNRYGVSIGKESKDSRKKIDLAVCVIGARMVRRLVVNSDAWKKRQRGSGSSGRIIVLD